MKRLVVLFDGTWNKPGKEDETTNVVKLHRVIPAADAQGVRQLVHYVVGIATEDLEPRLTFAIGAIGLGVGDRIRRGYTFLCENYEDGDEIYLIGFSRGAFQARSLAGLIALAGMARSAAPETVADVWDYYEQNKLEPDPARLEALRAAARYPVRIKCVAVWDTVGITGIPFIRKGAIKELLGFHDTQLSPLVDVGLHALAIDEPRGPFAPTFWTVDKGAALPEGQIVEQVWFPGSHANVGGGIKDCALSDIALLWMAERMGANDRPCRGPGGPAQGDQARSAGRAAVADLGRHLPGELSLPLRAPHQPGPKGNLAIAACAVRQLARRHRAGRPDDRQREHPRKRHCPVRQARAVASRRRAQTAQVPAKEPCFRRAQAQADALKRFASRLGP